MSDVSPELSARLQTLEGQYAENPAKFFMSLASALREAGSAGHAEEVLRENLKRHPGYLSAHVLLGRCLVDRGALEEAPTSSTTSSPSIRRTWWRSASWRRSRRARGAAPTPSAGTASCWPSTR
jgi:thioredoxin-like negative regulator of GroEL